MGINTQHDKLVRAINDILEIHAEQPRTREDRNDPLRQTWLRESAAGQNLKIAYETDRLLDIICWTRREPQLTTSVPEMVEAYGQQMAALATLALYLHDLTGVSEEALASSFEKAIGINKESEEQ